MVQDTTSAPDRRSSANQRIHNERWASSGTDNGGAVRVDAINTLSVSAGRFTSFRVLKPSISAGQRNFCDGFDSRQLPPPRRIGVVVRAWLFSLFRIARHGSLAVVL
jgi:hypothetical protein